MSLLILWYVDLLLGNDRETRKWPLLGSSPRAKIEVLLEAVFLVWSAQSLYGSTDRVQFS
jgi:hypothetical protein